MLSAPWEFPQKSRPAAASLIYSCGSSKPDLWLDESMFLPVLVKTNVGFHLPKMEIYHPDSLSKYSAK